MKKIVEALMVVMLLVTPVVGAGAAWAEPSPPPIPEGDGGGGTSTGGGSLGGGEGAFGGDRETPPAAGAPETSIIPNMEIKDLLKAALNILVYGLGVAAVLGVVIAGIMYLTARDSEAQVTKAKTRLIEIVIGLVAWAFMFGLLNWLIPGGLSF